MKSDRKRDEDMKKSERKILERRKYQEIILKEITDYLLKRIMFVNMFVDDKQLFNWADVAEYLNKKSYLTETCKLFTPKSIQMFMMRIPQEIKDKYKPDFESIDLLQFWHNYRYKSQGINSSNNVETLSGANGEYEDLIIDKLDFKLGIEEDNLIHLRS